MSTQRFFHGVNFGGSSILLQVDSQIQMQLEQRIRQLETNCEYLAYELTAARNVCHCARNYRDILTDEKNEEMSLSAGVLLDNAISTWEQLEITVNQ